MAWLSFVVALLAGAANPFQSGANAQLNKQLGQPLWATVVVYATGLAGVLLALAFVRERLPGMGQVHGVAWWAWLGGLISIASTMAGLMLAAEAGLGGVYGAEPDGFAGDVHAAGPHGMGGVQAAHGVPGAVGGLRADGGGAVDGGAVLKWSSLELWNSKRLSHSVEN